MRVIRENEWATILETESGVDVTKSLFLDGKFVIPAQRNIVNWATMSDKDRLDFLRAFHVRPNLQEEDQRFLD